MNTCILHLGPDLKWYRDESKAGHFSRREAEAAKAKIEATENGIPTQLEFWYRSRTRNVYQVVMALTSSGALQAGFESA